MKASILQELHQAAGARLIDGPDGPALLTYGDVPGEYAAGREGCALFDETDRGLVSIAGPDRVEFLHPISSNDVAALEPGGGHRSLLLTSKGKVVADFELAAQADRLLLSVGPGQAAELATKLDMYHFSEDIELVDLTDQAAPLALCGPRAAEVARAALGELGELGDRDHAELDFGSGKLRVSCLPIAGSAGLRLDAGPAGAAELWRALAAAGASPAGLVARDSLRCEAVRARFRVDVNETVYPQEARLEEAFSLSKGCYTGQEVVAKIDTYGGVNKCLVALRVSHDDPVPAGTTLVRELEGQRRQLGVVTSWAYSFALDGGLVLGYVKRRHQERDTLFELEGLEGQARVVELPVRPDCIPLTGEIE